MIVGVAQRCYTAPCRWYPGGPIGTIRYYWANPGASVLPFNTVFWPYQPVMQIENSIYPGEITGRGLRKWDNGKNLNNLPGTHYEGSAADFAGNGVSP
jgi:hypothetical protein